MEGGRWRVEAISIVDGSVEPHSGCRIQEIKIVESPPPPRSLVSDANSIVNDRLFRAQHPIFRA